MDIFYLSIIISYILPFSAHVSPTNPSAHLQVKLPSLLSQVAPFLHGELSQGLTYERKKYNVSIRLFFNLLLTSCIFNCWCVSSTLNIYQTNNAFFF